MTYSYPYRKDFYGLWHYACLLCGAGLLRSGDRQTIELRNYTVTSICLLYGSFLSDVNSVDDSI